MFTLKHVSEDGNETIYQSEEVQHTNGGMFGSTESVDPPPTVWRTSPHTREITPLTGGTVYVMNDEGKTVAIYRLSSNPALPVR